jgi:hypothetical protein
VALPQDKQGTNADELLLSPLSGRSAKYTGCVVHQFLFHLRGLEKHFSFNSTFLFSISPSGNCCLLVLYYYIIHNALFNKCLFSKDKH